MLARHVDGRRGARRHRDLHRRDPERTLRPLARDRAVRRLVGARDVCERSHGLRLDDQAVIARRARRLPDAGQPGVEPLVDLQQDHVVLGAREVPRLGDRRAPLVDEVRVARGARLLQDVPQHVATAGVHQHLVDRLQRDLAAGYVPTHP